MEEDPTNTLGELRAKAVGVGDEDEIRQSASERMAMLTRASGTRYIDHGGFPERSARRVDCSNENPPPSPAGPPGLKKGQRK